MDVAIGPLAVLVPADVAKVIGDDRSALVDWLEAGGVLIRFAGPRIAYRTRAPAALVPVRLLGGGSYLNGNLLLAYGGGNRVVEQDPGGKVIFSYISQNPRSAEKMSDGNYLIAERNGQRVTIVSPSGELVL